MRRLLSITMLALASTLVLATFALPGLATEGTTVVTEDAEHADDAEHAEDTEHADDAEHESPGDEIHDDAEEGQWTGLMASLVAGVLMGGYAFASAGTKGLDGHDEHH